jgi:hypothetical protein
VGYSIESRDPNHKTPNTKKKFEKKLKKKKKKKKKTFVFHIRMAVGGAPSLQNFIQRGQVLRLYRQLQRAAQQLEPGPRASVAEHIRNEFERHSSATGARVPLLIVEAQQGLKRLEEMIAMSSPPRQGGDQQIE